MDGEQDLQEQAQKIAEQYGLRAKIIPGIRSVGVLGDNRAYLPVVILSGEFPGWDVIREVSTRITNELKVGRVTLDI